MRLFLFFDAAQFAPEDGRAYLDETRAAFDHYIIGRKLEPLARL